MTNGHGPIVDRRSQTTQAQRDVRRKLKVLEYARGCGDIAKACRCLRISRQCCYDRLHAFEREGEAGPVDSRPCPGNHKPRAPKPVGDRAVHLRLAYHFGPHRIAWCLGRCHDIPIPPHGVHGVLVRNGIDRLPVNCRQRSTPGVIRYEKQVPGHHVQVDVKFLDFVDPDGRKVRRFQYTAIDDTTRIRALRTCEKHTQANAIDSVDHVIERFPFRIRTIRTDNGHESQVGSHWHVEGRGVRHVHTKPAGPDPDGRVERSHLTDKLESYQLLDSTDDVDPRKKPVVWGKPCNVHRPHGGLGGKALYEVLREKMAS